MQQKFISHPDQSSIVNLSKVDIVNRSHDGDKPLIVFSAFGSEDYSAWAFDTHEQAREVYDWVLEQLPVVRYSQFGPVQMAEQVESFMPMPPSTVVDEEIAPAGVGSFYRDPVVIDGINRPIRKFYFGLTDGDIETIIAELQAMPENARFTLADIHCTKHASEVQPLLMDLGCVTAGDGAWEKTQIPF